MKGKLLPVTITVVSLVMVVYQLAATQFVLLDPILHQNLHYALALALIILGAAVAAERLPVRIFWLVVLVGAIVATGYVHLFFNDLTLRQGSPTSLDLVIGILLVLLALITTWKAYGPVIPILAVLFLVYTLTAKIMPGVLQGYSPSFSRLVSMLSIGLSGMYGSLLGTSANFIFLFLVFGAIMQVSGVNTWFNELGKLAGRATRGGPAQTAIVASSLVGMMSGSAAANVGITGVLTIPLMKNSGFTPEKAGAIEAAASSGGQITPPIMGAAAFVMADILGISYLKVLAMAAIPAIFYYFSLFIDVELTARRDGLKSSYIPIDFREFILRFPLFAVPMIILIYLMFQNYSAGYAAFWAIVSLLVLSYLRKDTRPKMADLVQTCVTGARSGSEIAVVCAALSPIWVTMTLTGLGIKLPAAIEALSAGNLTVALLLVGLVSIILGMGVPTLAAYLLVAITTAPALVRMGVAPEAAHLAVLYFAVFSAMTPPFAIAAIVASRIAGSNYFQTGIQSFLLGFFKLLLPVFFVFNPVLLGLAFHPVTGSLILGAMVLVIIFGTALKVRYLLVRLNWWEFLICAATAILLGGYVITTASIFGYLGIIGVTVMILEQVTRAKTSKLSESLAQ